MSLRAESHHSHRDVNGGWLRPAVFGAMDGLVSNFALIAGVAGGSDSTKAVALAGIAELAEVLKARGVEDKLALEVARQLSVDPENALAVHTQTELGIAPGDLPDPRKAAISSFFSFTLGAILPLLPYLFGVTDLWLSAVVSCLALVGAGALVSRVTARSWWYSGLRQLLVGGLAAALTFGLGNLIGASGL